MRCSPSVLNNALRFRPYPGIRERLEAIVAAEARCCAFLGFDLREDAGDLVLTIAPPPTPSRSPKSSLTRSRPSERSLMGAPADASQRRNKLFGIAGALMALCCVAGPRFGAAAGAAIGNVLGVVAAIVIAVAGVVVVVAGWAYKGC